MKVSLWISLISSVQVGELAAAGDLYYVFFLYCLSTCFDLGIVFFDNVHLFSVEDEIGFTLLTICLIHKAFVYFI